jgi:flagellar protein FliO/FliZ
MILGRGDLKSQFAGAMLCVALLMPLAGWGQAAKNETAKQSPPDEKTLLLGDQSNAQPSPNAAAIGGFGVWDFVRMVLVLAGVVGMIFAFFHFLRRATFPKATASAITVLETQNLYGSRNLHLVEAGMHLFLVGSSEEGVRLVSEIADRESIDEIRLKLSQKPAANRPAFSEMVRKALRGKAGPPAAAQPGAQVDVPLDFMRKQKERLKKLT